MDFFVPSRSLLFFEIQRSLCSRLNEHSQAPQPVQLPFMHLEHRLSFRHGELRLEQKLLDVPHFVSDRDELVMRR